MVDYLDTNEGGQRSGQRIWGERRRASVVVVMCGCGAVELEPGFEGVCSRGKGKESFALVRCGGREEEELAACGRRRSRRRKTMGRTLLGFWV